MAERKIHNYESVILPELTEKEEGFNPDEKGWQKKYIWAVCRYCGNPHRVYGANFKKSGSACHKECRFKEQSEAGSPFADPQIKKKAKENRTKNVSIEELGKRISVGRRKSQSKLEETCLEKYGVRNPFQSEEVKEKIKKTNLEKYGVSHISLSPEIRKRAIQTCIEKYGSKNPCRNLDVQRKISESWKSRVANFPEKYPVISFLRSDEFWEAIKLGESLVSISESSGISYQTIASMLSNDEFKERFRNSYSYPKTQKQNTIANHIEKLGFDVISNTKNIITPYELDIYVPDKKFAMEFNGSAWHSELMLSSAKARRVHFNKYKRCKSEGIELFHLFERTWETRQSQVMNLLKSKLGCNEKIFARKCTINNDHCPSFIDDNHIQPAPSLTKKYFNLLHDGEIVGSMTAATHHRLQLEDSIVLSRLCFKDGITVVGGASRLFKAFKIWASSEGYKKIISWSDNIYTTGGIYQTLGFELEDESEPDYFYWDMRRNEYVAKQSQSKKKSKCPAHMTEREWAMERGLYRIYDCGKKRWVFKI